MTLGEMTLRQVPVVEPSTAIDEVVGLMQGDPLGTVVLVGDEQYMGVFNQDALDSGLIPTGANLADLAVGPYVHPARVVAEKRMAAGDVLAHAERRGVDVVPVVDGPRYLGVVTRADLTKAA